MIDIKWTFYIKCGIVVSVVRQIGGLRIFKIYFANIGICFFICAAKDAVLGVVKLGNTPKAAWVAKLPPVTTLS
ncbi:MAG: hypothetical protein IPF62_11645 [Bacteroidetes bacterium]|nr:hypothetical protein [Bacteroidota bacterium]